MIEKISWEEFRETGLLWWINMQLHLFGISIIFDIEETKNTEFKVNDVYPAKVDYKGFSEKLNDEGYKRLSQYIKEKL